MLNYERGCPITRNSEAETTFAADVAVAVVGEGRVNCNTPPRLGCEDFCFMLNARPGAFIFIGNGDTAGVSPSAVQFQR